jgi:steroid delta-isomerase-like uncharacterized protein
MPEAEAVRRVTAELIAAWNRGDVEALGGLCTPDYEGIDVADAAPQRGPAGLRRAALRYLAAFPDLQTDTELALVEGSQAVLLCRMRGTHCGPILNIPPTGRAIDVRGVCVLTLAGGRIRRALFLWDVAAMLRSMGLLPELRPALEEARGDPASVLSHRRWKR